MFGLFFVLLVGLELKHYIADYFMQPGWILAGKGDFRKPGGYAHAGIHALLHGKDASKHSQYFLRHILLRHLHPLLCAGCWACKSR